MTAAAKPIQAKPQTEPKAKSEDNAKVEGEPKLKRKSSYVRLKELPAVFTGRELAMRYGWDSTMAAVYCNRWGKDGLAMSAGVRSDVYFNLVVEKNWEIHLGEAALRMYPDAIKVGAQILVRYGWVTQHSTLYEVAIPEGMRVYKSEVIFVHPRPKPWFGVVSRNQALDKDDPQRALSPAWALADLAVFEAPGLPDSDDLYLHGHTARALTVATAIRELAGLKGPKGLPEDKVVELTRVYARESL